MTVAAGTPIDPSTPVEKEQKSDPWLRLKRAAHRWAPAALDGKILYVEGVTVSFDGARGWATE